MSDKDAKKDAPKKEEKGKKEEKQVPWYVEEKLENYTLEENPQKLKVGKLFKAKRAENGEREYMIKRIKNSEKNQGLIKREEETMMKACHRSLAPLVSVFKDEKYVYHVFKGYTCESVAAAIKDDKFFNEEAASYMAIQFLNFLDTLHKQGVHYLREDVDNIYFTSKNDIKIYGLDADDERVKSYILKVDDKIDDTTDYFALAEFIAHIMKGKKVEDLGSSDLPDEIMDLIKKLTDKDQKARQEFKPRKDKFLTPTIVAKVESESVQLGEFKVDWSDGGLVLYFGETGIGYRNGFYFESGDDNMTIGGEGFQFESETFDFSLGPDGLEMHGNKDLPFMLRTHLRINADGFYCALGEGLASEESVSVGPGGVEYKVAGTHLLVGTGFECTLDTDRFTVNKEVSSSGTRVMVNTMFEALVGTMVYVRIGTASLKISTEGMILRMRPVELRFLTSGKIELAMGGLTFSISTEGLKFEMGNFLFQLASTMRLECEGFKAIADGDGFHLENENAPFDFKQYTSNIPKISFSMPEIHAPPTPQVPTPEIPTPGIGDLLSCCLLV